MRDGLSAQGMHYYVRANGVVFDASGVFSPDQLPICHSIRICATRAGYLVQHAVGIPARNATSRFRKTRDMLTRAGWSAARIADVLGVSAATASAYAAEPDSVRWRAVPQDRLDSIRKAAADEARAFLDGLRSIIDEVDRDAA